MAATFRRNTLFHALTFSMFVFLMNGAGAFSIDGWRLGMTKSELKAKGLGRCIDDPYRKNRFRCYGRSRDSRVSQVLLMVDANSGRLVEIGYWIPETDVSGIADLYRILALSACTPQNKGAPQVAWQDSCFEAPDRMRVIGLTSKLIIQESAPSFGPTYWYVRANYDRETVTLQRREIQKRMMKAKRLDDFNNSPR